jgi:hypothetical protein
MTLSPGYFGAFIIVKKYQPTVNDCFKIFFYVVTFLSSII